nr:amidase [Autographiviridae sp.]
MSFVNLKWKKRDATDYIYIVKRDLKGVDIETLRNKCIRKGGLDTGYHYVIRANGDVEPDRPDYAYAGWCFAHEERSVSVLIDTAGTGKVTMASKKALKKILSKYPKAEVKEVEMSEEEEI